MVCLGHAGSEIWSAGTPYVLVPARGSRGLLEALAPPMKMHLTSRRSASCEGEAMEVSDAGSAARAAAGRGIGVSHLHEAVVLLACRKGCSEGHRCHSRHRLPSKMSFATCERRFHGRRIRTSAFRFLGSKQERAPAAQALTYSGRSKFGIFRCTFYNSGCRL